MTSHGPVVTEFDWDTYDMYTMYIALKRLYESGIDETDGIYDLHHRSGTIALFFYQLILKMKEDIERNNKEIESLK